MATLIAAWLVGSGTILTIYLIAAVRSAQEFLDDIGYRLGATCSCAYVKVSRASWLQASAYYLAFVIVPPLVVLWLWRRSRRPRRMPSDARRPTAS